MTSINWDEATRKMREEQDRFPEIGRFYFLGLGYIPYKPAIFWKTEVKVRTVEQLSNDDLKRRLKIMLKLFFLKNNPLQTITYAQHLASQLRDPRDTSQLIINPTLFHQDQVVEGIVGNIDHNVPDTDILMGNGLKLYNLLTNEKYMKSSYIWGPALAALLMTAEKKSVASVLYKLRNLGQELSNSFPNDDVSFPVKIDQHTWSEFIEPLKEQRWDKVLNNTVKFGYIASRHQENATPQVHKILDFLLLQTLRHQGMALISLPLEICQYYGCTPADLRRLTTQFYVHGVHMQWETFDKVMRKYETDPYWPYIKEFNHCVFPCVAYANSYQLCQILALIKDCIYGANPRTVSVYNQMQANRTKIPPAPEESRIIAESAYQALEQQFLVEL